MIRYKSFLVLIFLSCVVKYTECSLILEDGYTVETVFDGHKADNCPFPYTILPLEKGIILLDSVKSTLYRISLPLSKDNLVELYAGAGRGVEGFVDGDPKKAEFKHPKAFTVDGKGNVYVADRENFAVRKISKSGVSTIAGGMASKRGNTDGPSQNATFSNDFDVTFIPSICALLVSDRGNKMIRQIKLPHSECKSGSGTLWVIPGAACLSFFLGLVVMFFLQPYIAAYIAVHIAEFGAYIAAHIAGFGAYIAAHIAGFGAYIAAWTGWSWFSREKADEELLPNERGEAKADEEEELLPTERGEASSEWRDFLSKTRTC